jgi:hypothetical protein
MNMSVDVHEEEQPVRAAGQDVAGDVADPAVRAELDVAQQRVGEEEHDQQRRREFGQHLGETDAVDTCLGRREALAEAHHAEEHHRDQEEGHLHFPTHARP